MENSTPPVGEPDSIVDGGEVSPKRRRVSEAINQTLQEWIRRRSLRQDEDYFVGNSDGPESGEADKKTGKVRKFLRLFFGGHVKRESLPEVDASGHGRPLEALTSLSGDSPVREVPLDPLPAIAYERLTPAAPQQSDNSRVEGVVPLYPERSSASTDQAVDVPPVTDTSSVDSSEKEWVIIDRSRQTRLEADLKAAERRNRNRQRKQKQDLRHTKHQLKKVETAQKHTERKVKEQVATQATLEAIQKKAQPVVEHTTDKSPPIIPIERQAKQSDNPAQSVREILEKRIKPLAEQPVATPPHELSKTRHEAVRPAVILETVEKAAEENVAIEGLFERRHETKDVDGGGTAQSNTTSVPTSPRSVGSSAQPLLNPSLPPASIPVRPVGASQVSQATTRQSTDYKQAARKGFWAAVVLLLFVAVMAILT